MLIFLQFMLFPSVSYCEYCDDNMEDPRVRIDEIQRMYAESSGFDTMLFDKEKMALRGAMHHNTIARQPSPPAPLPKGEGSENL